MIFSGKTISVAVAADSPIAHCVLDREGSSVNKFDRVALGELREAVAALAGAEVIGAVFRSAKEGFVVGADIMEFTAMFARDAATIEAWLAEANAIFNAIEDLPFPTVTAIDGVALGGGFELAIATDYRLATAAARVGFPEVKLGILPGFGGTVRLPRLIGADNANEWIASGRQYRVEDAMAAGAVDAIVAAEHLPAAAETMLRQCAAGKLDYQAGRRRKRAPLTLAPVECTVAFETALAAASAAAGSHYPAPVTAIKAMQDAAECDRAAALLIEHRAFAQLATTDIAANLVGMFLSNQFLAGLAKRHMAKAGELRRAAVLGAGIMGGGIACQSALRGVPIVMKDIAAEGLALGMAEARRTLGKRVARGRMEPDAMLDAMLAITPTLGYEGFGQVDIVVEAVVENLEVKKRVLAELESQVGPATVIATNTSTLSIATLAGALREPSRFCGMHFFNPVSAMPLVEVVRGPASDARAVATAVAYARRLGKTPIVVKDCPGFLVNRVLFPYFGAFSRLLHEGADFRQVDRCMEAFGWPMGPAYLLDVVGLDTAVHAQAIMARGFERMQLGFTSVIERLHQAGHLGQKSGAGFYRYEKDKRGKPRKLPNPAIADIIRETRGAERAFSDEEIIERLMLPLCLEAIRCLEDGIIGTAVEADMAMVLGLGFPAFRGGPLRYVDSLGVDEFRARAERQREAAAGQAGAGGGKGVDAADGYAAMCEPPALLRTLADAGGTFHDAYGPTGRGAAGAGGKDSRDGGQGGEGGRQGQGVQEGKGGKR